MDERSYLIQLTDNEQLKGNKLLHLWALRYNDLNIRQLKPFFDKLEEVSGAYGIKDIKEQLAKIDKQGESNPDVVEDLRIKEVILSGFRGIPRSEVKYRLAFMLDGKPCNAVVYGNNGSGKSSVYQAIEYAISGKIGEANLRNYNPPSNKPKDRYVDYSANYWSDFGFSTDNKVITMEKEIVFEENQPRNAIAELSFFSESDIHEVGQIEWQDRPSQDNTIHNFIARKLGLDYLVNLSSWLSTLGNYKSRNLTQDMITYEERLSDLKVKIHDIRNLLADTQKPETLNDKSNPDKLDVTSLHFKPMPLITSQEMSEKIDTTTNQLIQLGSHIESDIGRYVSFLELGLKLPDVKDHCPYCEQPINKEETYQSVANRIMELRIRDKKLADLHSVEADLNNALESIVAELTRIDTQIAADHEKIKTDLSLHELSNLYYDVRSIVRQFMLSEALRIRISITESDYELQIEQLSKLKQFFDTEYRFFQDYYLKMMDQITTLLANISEQSTRDGEPKPHDPAMLQSQLKLIKDDITKVEQELETKRKKENFIIESNNEAREIKKIVDLELNEKLERLITPLETSIVNVLENYLNDDNLSIIFKKPQISNQGDISNLSIMLSDKVTEKQFNPAKYFNSFRFKLFCFVVQVGLLIACRKEHRLNLPLIIDDAFYASDFTNIVWFKDTLSKIIAAFQSSSAEMPIQLILFTHDTNIYQSASEALLESSPESTILYRLFKHDQAERENEYWNLAYRMLSNKQKNTLLR